MVELLAGVLTLPGCCFVGPSGVWVFLTTPGVILRFLALSGDGVCSNLGVPRRPSFPVASNWAAGDMLARRSILVRISGEPMLRRAVSKAICFWLRIFSLTFSAKAMAMVSRLEFSLIRNEGPWVGRKGVSPPSRRKGVPSISPQVMIGEKASPGRGEGEPR